jgi:hypothetical protein
MQVLGQERRRHYNRGRVRTTGFESNEVKLLPEARTMFILE